MKTNKGFTLIELIAAIVIITIISIPLSVVISQYVLHASAGQDLSQAMELCRLELEKVAVDDYDNVTPSDFYPYENTTYGLNRQVLIIDSTPGNGLKKVNVGVYKKERALSKTISEFTSYKVEDLVFGDYGGSGYSDGEPVCGDLICENPDEDCSSCPADCGICPGGGDPDCGNGICDSPPEGCYYCPEDCSFSCPMY